MNYINFKKLKYCKSETEPKEYDFKVDEDYYFEYPFEKINLSEFNEINKPCIYPMKERNVKLIFNTKHCYILENGIYTQTFEITEKTGFKIGLYLNKKFNNIFDNILVEKNKNILLNTKCRKEFNEFIASFCDC